MTEEGRPGNPKDEVSGKVSGEISGEISNVDLQFMGSSDEKRDLKATVKAESQAAKVSETPEVKGMDKQDVTVAQSMDASDPPSSNMGEEEK